MSVLPEQALGQAEQAARVQRWADLEDDAKLGAALTGLSAPAEVGKRVGDLRTTQQVLRIQRVSPTCGAV